MSSEIKTETKVATNYKLVIPDDIYQKISYWLTKTKNEVSGFGSLDYDLKSNTFTVKDVKLLKQKVTSASTEIDPTAIGKMMYDMREEPMGMKWHWHTHPNMGVFWSADDMEVIRSLGQQGWILATVFNEKGETKSAFYSTATVPGPTGPTQHDIFHNDLETSVVRFLPQSFFNELDKEYDLCVSNEPNRISAVQWHGHGYYDAEFDGRYREDLRADKNPEELFIPDTLSEKRWEPTIKLDFNNFGYAEWPEKSGRYIYNPVHDDELHSEEEQMYQIFEMTEEEVTFLRRNDTEFAVLVQKLMTHEASKTEGVIEV